MIKSNRFLAVALALAVCTAFLAFGIPSEAFAASSPVHGHGSDILRAIMEHAPVIAGPLAVLRADLEALTKRAAEKIAELKDDTPADKARTIQEEHSRLLTEIEAKKRDISTEEERERSAGQQTNQTQQPNNAGGSDAARAADILDIGTRAGMPPEAIQEAIRNGETLADFRARAFDMVVGRQNQTRTDPARVSRDERETHRAAMTEALSYRMGAPMPYGEPSQLVRERLGEQARRLGMVRVAMECLGERSFPEIASEREELFRRAAHTTSDFPIIMENSMNRTLETRYRLALPTYRRIARRRDFQDFRPHTIVKTGDFPMLERVVENGEIKYGTLTEGKETLSVLSYAKALSVSRQLMINDDLGAIQEMLSDYGSTVALFEEITFYSQAFNGKLADGKTVFHLDHANLAASGAGIDVDTVSVGRAAMSKQKSLDGNPLLSNAPAQIVTGPDRITSAEKLVASITPATLASVNIFSGRLTPFDTAQITGNDWYLFAALEAGSNYRWGYLSGYEAPRVRVETPFGRQGMAMSVEHDFGCGAVDYRYGFKNPGA